jgi:HK97 family phage portal protein
VPRTFFPRLQFSAPPPPVPAVAVADSGSVEGKTGGLLNLDFFPMSAGGAVVPASLANTSTLRLHHLLYACLTYLADKLAEPPLWITEEDASGEEHFITGEHELEALLERPNPDDRMSDLLRQHAHYMNTGGACLWVKSRDRVGRVAQLSIFKKSEFEVRQKYGRRYGEFTVRTSSGSRTYGPTEVIFFRTPDPDNLYTFVSPTDAALSRVRIEATLEESLRAALRNTVVPGLVVTTKAAPGERVHVGQLQEIQTNITVALEGAARNGKTLVLPPGAEAKRNKPGFGDLSGGTLSEENEVAICTAFKIPPVVVGARVGLTNSSDRHNLETSVTLVYDNAVRPAWTALEDGLTDGLLREVDPNTRRRIRFDTSKVKALQPKPDGTTPPVSQETAP